MTDLDQKEKILKSKNISPTAMRIRVLEYFQMHDFAVSLAEMDKDFERADRITLYRTLKTFEKQGLIHSIKEENATKYALCFDDCEEHSHRDSHLHFHCTKCKQTYCMPSIKIPDLRLPSNYYVEELNLIIKGVCEKCNVKILQ